MNPLELKIPPVALGLIVALLMWLTSLAAPVFGFMFLTQRQRQSQFADQGHETGPGSFPKDALNELLQPPLSPPLQGSPLDAQGFPQRLHPLRLQAMVHGRNQHHHHPDIDPASQKADRGRSQAVTLLGAGETAPLIPMRRAAAGFSIIIVAVQFGSATPAPLFFGRLRQIRIDFFQKPM